MKSSPSASSKGGSSEAVSNDIKTPPTKRRFLVEITVLTLCTAIAVSLWISRIRTDDSLKTAPLAQLTERVKTDPENARVHYYLGVRQQEAGDRDAAKTSYKKAAELDGDMEDAWIGWAKIAEQKGEIQEAFSVLTVYLKAHPKSVEANLTLAAFYHGQDAVQRAYETAQKAAELDPKNVRAWRRVATEALDLAFYPEAEIAIQKALALVPDDWRSYYLLGVAQKRQKREKEALVSFQKSAELAPKESSPLREVGALQLASATDVAGYQAALNVLEKAQKADPQNGEIALLLGKAQIALKNETAAKTAFEEAVRLAPNDAPAYFELANLYRKAGDTKRADQLKSRHAELESYRLDKGNLLSLIYQDKENVEKSNERRLKLARLYAKFGDFDLALREYRHLQARLPDDATIKTELAEVEAKAAAIQASNASRLASDARPADDARPAGDVRPAGDGRPTPNILLAQADSLMEQGRIKEAKRIFVQALLQDKKSAPAYLGLGQALASEGDNENAFRAFQRALKFDPNLAAAELALARLYLTMGFADETIHRVEKLLTKEPNNALYCSLLGNAYLKVEVFGPAEQAFARAVAADPQNADYLANLAFVQAKNNKFADAEKNFRAAAQHDPQNANLLAFFGSFLNDRAQATGKSELATEAEEMLKRSLSLSPKNFTASFALGNLYLNRNDAPQATGYLLTANEQRPDIIPVYYRLSLTYERLGDKAKADYYRKEFRRRSEYNERRVNTEQLARERLKDAALRLKLARIYAEGGDNARAVNQYQVYLNMRPKDALAKTELDALLRKLNAGRPAPAPAPNAPITAASPAPNAANSQEGR